MNKAIEKHNYLLKAAVGVALLACLFMFVSTAT
jgi:hypothetical protein